MEVVMEVVMEVDQGTPLPHHGNGPGYPPGSGHHGSGHHGS